METALVQRSPNSDATQDSASESFDPLIAGCVNGRILNLKTLVGGDRPDCLRGIGSDLYAISLDREGVQSTDHSLRSVTELVDEAVSSQFKWRDLGQDQRISVLAIVVLRNVYDNFVFLQSQNPVERAKRESGDLNNGSFFDVVHVLLPEFNVSADPYFKLWRRFIDRVREFLDSSDPTQLLEEVFAVEEKVRSRATGMTSKEGALMQILREFEIRTGFSEVLQVLYPANASGDNIIYSGLLDLPDFFNIIFRGEAFNDYGASKQHGMLSHRFQIYLIGENFLRNPELYFSNEEFATLRGELESRGQTFSSKEDLLRKVPSIFYRLLGDPEFNAAFDWKSFLLQRDALNAKGGQNTVHPELNTPYIWTQLVDRYGYRGYLSAPASFACLQFLGAFSGLPLIGKPDIRKSFQLKQILCIAKSVLGSAVSQK